MDDEGVSDIADLLERAALTDGTIDPDRVQELIEAVDPDDRLAQDRRIFAILLGLDRALLYANPYFGGFDQGALTSIAVRYCLTGVLNSDPRHGALLPRCAMPGRPQQTPNTLNDAFAGVVWVPEAEWLRTSHIRIPARNDLTRVERQAEFGIACVPFVDDPSEFEWEVVERHGGRFYRIRLRTPSPVADRVARLLSELDISGAVMAVLPELTLTDELLETWQDVLDRQPQPTESNLKWIFVGSGNLGDGDTPVNRCVLLDRVTGELVLTQQKLHPFTLTAEQLADWNLRQFLGAEPIEEDIKSNRRVTIAESRLGRVAVLVCEDLARIFDLGPTLRSHGLSHLFSPVFSKETQPHYWEHAHAKKYAEEVGALVVVSNSLVVPRLMGTEGRCGTSMIHSPATTQVRSSDDWSTIVIFRVFAGDPVARVGDVPFERADDESFV